MFWRSRPRQGLFFGKAAVVGKKVTVSTIKVVENAIRSWAIWWFPATFFCSCGLDRKMVAVFGSPPRHLLKQGAG